MIKPKVEKDEDEGCEDEEDSLLTERKVLHNKCQISNAKFQINDKRLNVKKLFSLKFGFYLNFEL